MEKVEEERESGGDRPRSNSSLKANGIRIR